MLNVAIPKSLSDTNFHQDSLPEGSTPSEQGTRFSPAQHQTWAMSETSVAASGRTWSTVPGTLSFDLVWYPNIAWMHDIFASDAPENGPLVIFNAIQRLYCQDNSRDRRIAERLKTLYRDALDECEEIQAASVRQFAEFFIAHSALGFPKITLTPDGTLRVRWIAGPGNFTAIEFTGTSLVKLVAEIPRDSAIAQYFASELVSSVVSVARDLGASFA